MTEKEFHDMKIKEAILYHYSLEWYSGNQNGEILLVIAAENREEGQSYALSLVEGEKERGNFPFHLPGVYEQVKGRLLGDLPSTMFGYEIPVRNGDTAIHNYRRYDY